MGTDSEIIKSILTTGLNKLVSSLKRNGGGKRQNTLYITDLMVLNSVVPEDPLSLSPTSTEIQSRNPQTQSKETESYLNFYTQQGSLRKNPSRGRNLDSS